MGRLNGKTAIVTGAGQGIGAGIARVFAAEGANVVVATRSADNGQATVDAITGTGGQANLVAIDVREDKAVRDLVAHTVATCGGLDIMVHNAAAFGKARTDSFDPVLYQKIQDTNLRAAFTLSEAAIPHMRHGGGGRLLFTSSVTGQRVVMPGSGYYGASKGGLNGFIRTAALELAPDRITVNGVEPGFILTEAIARLTDDAGRARMERFIPAGHMGVPEDIAYAMLYLASDEASYVTGQTIVVDGGSTLPESPIFFEED